MQIVTLINFFIVEVPPILLRPAGAAAHSPGQRPEDNEAMSHAQQGQKRHSICQMNPKKGEKAVVQNDTSLGKRSI